MALLSIRRDVYLWGMVVNRQTEGLHHSQVRSKGAGGRTLLNWQREELLAPHKAADLNLCLAAFSETILDLLLWQKATIQKWNVAFGKVDGNSWVCRENCNVSLHFLMDNVQTVNLTNIISSTAIYLAALCLTTCQGFWEEQTVICGGGFFCLAQFI